MVSSSSSSQESPLLPTVDSTWLARELELIAIFDKLLKEHNLKIEIDPEELC